MQCQSEPAVLLSSPALRQDCCWSMHPVLVILSKALQCQAEPAVLHSSSALQQDCCWSMHPVLVIFSKALHTLSECSECKVVKHCSTNDADPCMLCLSTALACTISSQAQQRQSYLDSTVNVNQSGTVWLPDHLQQNCSCAHQNQIFPACVASTAYTSLLQCWMVKSQAVFIPCKE